MQENTPFGVSELLVQAQRMKKWYEEALHAVAVQYGLTMNELSVLLMCTGMAHGRYQGC